MLWKLVAVRLAGTCYDHIIGVQEQIGPLVRRRAAESYAVMFGQESFERLGQILDDAPRLIRHVSFVAGWEHPSTLVAA